MGAHAAQDVKLEDEPRHMGLLLERGISPCIWRERAFERSPKVGADHSCCCSQRANAEMADSVASGSRGWRKNNKQPAGGNPAITVPKEGDPVLSAQAQEMIELLTACQRRIVFYLVVGFLTGFVFGVSVACIMTR